MEKAIIKIRNMSFKYKEKNIFNKLNLDIFPGTFVSIIGKNASGKSTLAKILVGLLKSEGYINIDGYLLSDFYLAKIRRSLAIAFDNPSSNFVGETVMDDLAFSLENLEYTPQEIETAISNIAKKFKIESLLSKSPEELTTSQKIKVNIASLLIHSPRILLIDETTYGLTPSDKKLIFKIIKEYQVKYKLTVILITHNLEDTLLSDRIILLDKGKIIKDGPKEEIYKDDSLEKMGFSLPFIVKLSHNLMLYDLLDKVYFDEKEVIDKLWE